MDIVREYKEIGEVGSFKISLDSSTHPTRLKGSCIYYGKDYSDVIGFMKRKGKWTVSTSICLPSNIEEAKIIRNCFDEAFDVLKYLPSEY